MILETVRGRRSLPARVVAERFGVSIRTVKRVMCEHRDDYENRAADRRATAARMRANGASWAEIAEAIGGSEWAARALVRRAKQATD